MGNETPYLPKDLSGPSILDSLKAKTELLREGKSLPRDFCRFEQFLGRRLTELLGTVEDRFTDSEFGSAANAFLGLVASEGRVIQALANALLRLDDAEDKVPPEVNSADLLRGQIRAHLAIEKMLKPTKGALDITFNEMLENPALGVFNQMERLIWQRRLFRRYLRSRFGIKHMPTGRQDFQRTRWVEDAPFAIWLSKRRKGGHHFAEGEVDELFSLWHHEQLRDRALLLYVQRRLMVCEAQFGSWLIALAVFHDQFVEHDTGKVDLTTFLAEVLIRMKTVLKEFHFHTSNVTLQLRKDFDDDRVNMLAQTELARLSAWAISSISLALNRRVAESLETDNKPTLESLMDRVPAAILLALDDRAQEERFLPGGGATSVFSRIAGMLEQDLPLEAKHEDLKKGNLRKRRGAGQSMNSEEESSHRNDSTGRGNLADLQAQDFMLREETRFALDSLAVRAGLSPRESAVLELSGRDHTGKEIAAALNIAESTVHVHKSNAITKLQKAAGLK